MVDLPTIPNRPPNVRAPDSRVSPGAIMSPYVELANNLELASRETGEFAKREAREAGLKAVTRDDAGNIQIERAPIIGDAALEYEKSTKVAATAIGEDIVKTDMLQARHKYKDDPEAFRVYADKYATQKQTDYTKTAGAEVGLALGKIARNTGREFHEGLLNQKEHFEEQKNAAAIKVQIDQTKNEVWALASGGDTASPAVNERLQKIGALYGRLASNPRNAIPRERVDYELSQFKSELDVAALGYRIAETQKNKGTDAALAEADRIRTDPSLNLTPEHRFTYHSRIVQGIAARERATENAERHIANDIQQAGKRSADGFQDPPGHLEVLRQAVQNSKNPALEAALNEVETIAPIAAEWRKMSPAVLEQNLGELERVMQENGASPTMRKLRDVGEHMLTKMREGVKHDQLGWANRTGVASVPPLNFDAPDLPAQMRERAATGETVAKHYGVAPVYLRPDERAQFADALMSPDPQRAINAQVALNEAPPDMQAHMLRGKEIKEAISSAATSPDPARYSSAMTFMDRVWTTRGPEATKAIFGEDSIHSLMTWQSKLRYMSPEALAEERKRGSDDPQVRERRKVNEHEGREISRKEHKIDDIVSQFDTFLRLPGTGPQAPTDPLTRDTLMGDFENVFARRYAETLDKSTALKQSVEMLKTKWAPSPANNNKLMLNGPEKLHGPDGSPIYPAINGSWDWMKPQLEVGIATQVGKPMRAKADATNPYGEKNWDYSLVADRQTQAEAQNGKLASYQVVVTDAQTGRATVMPKRFIFDPTEPLAKSRAKFETERKARGEMFPGFTFEPSNAVH